MRKVIGIGETILDIVFKGNQPYAAVPGGSVFNGLVSLGRLGEEVLFISEIGNDRVGDMIQSFMEENNISTEYVDRFPDGKSPLSLAFLDENRNANYIFYKDYPKQRLEVPLPPIEEDDIFIFGSYYSLNPHEAIHVMPSVLENFEYADIVRGSDEDFLNLFGETDLDKVYQEHIQFYCNLFLTTRGEEGVDLRTPEMKLHFDTPHVQPLSTIGAGDNFNAGVLYGLLKYNIRKRDLPSLSAEDWEKVIRCGIELAVEVCQSYDNYIARRK